MEILCLPKINLNLVPNLAKRRKVRGNFKKMKYKLTIFIIVIISLIAYNLFIRKNEDSKFESEQIVYFPIKQINKDSIINIYSKDYVRYIFTKNTTENYILKMIEEYGELNGEEDAKLYDFGISTYGDWKIIQVDKNLSFYAYHNLVGWFFGYEENPEIPEFSIGFAKNIENVNYDYIFHLDPENERGDTGIGVFDNGKSFFIYLPDAYEENGNLTVTDKIKLSKTEKIEFISNEGLEISKINDLNFSIHKIKMYH